MAVASSATDLTAWGASRLSEAIHARKLSCREVMQAYLGRIARINPQVNAIVSLRDEGELLQEADAHDALLARGQSKGWMHGMPQAIKDLSNARGLRTSMGSLVASKAPAAEDGLMAARMRAAGAIFIGKTNVPEFGLGSHTFNSVFGATRNPYDPGKSAGGSSGGAAAALAAHLLPVADGSDFMGSLRNPAGWCNVVGFRPSQGRVPMWPALDSFISQLGTEGPMGRCVEDVSRLLEVQAGYDARAPLSIAGYGHSEAFSTSFDLKTLRVGWLGNLAGRLPMEAGVLAACEGAVARLQEAGAQVQPASLGTSDELEQVWQAWLLWRRALVAARLTPYLADPAQRAQLKPEAQWEADQAAALKGTELMAASQQRTAFYHRFRGLFERFDILVLPSAQVWPFAVEERWPKQIAGRAMDTYHRWMEVTIYATFAGLPAVCMPAGFSAGGLPMGVQLIGPPRGDAQVLRAARAYEGLIQDWMERRPAVGG